MKVKFLNSKVLYKGEDGKRARSVKDEIYDLPDDFALVAIQAGNAVEIHEDKPKPAPEVKKSESITTNPKK